MELRKPLTELPAAQVQRPARRKMDPRKVYGKRSHTGVTRPAIFNDENEMANQMAVLRLAPPSDIAGVNNSTTEKTPPGTKEPSTLVQTALSQKFSPLHRQRTSPGHHDVPTVNRNDLPNFVPLRANNSQGMRTNTSLHLAPPMNPATLTSRSSDETPDEQMRRSKEQFLKQIDILQNNRPNTSSAATYIAKKNDVDYVKPLLAIASVKELHAFASFADSLVRRYSLTKIAEGSYGECYKIHGRPDSLVEVLDEGVIIKLIPINPDTSPDSNTYSSVGQLVHEARILRRLDEMHGFPRFRGLRVVQGRYPLSFLEAFNSYKTHNSNVAHNPDPDTTYDHKQMFAVFDMSDAGRDLESLLKPSVFQIFDIFWSTAILLAMAEGEVEFEHRDLHVGNVCIKSSILSGAIDIDPKVTASQDSLPQDRLGLSNIRTTIIDYTLSRATVNEMTKEPAFNDMMNFPFNEKGRGSEAMLQCSTYRRMQTCISENDRNFFDGRPAWSRFVPKTNVVWLVYLLRILLQRAKMGVVDGSSPANRQLQMQMYNELLEIGTRWNSCTVKSLPRSARQLVEEAVARGWLTQQDVDGFKAKLEVEA